MLIFWRGFGDHSFTSHGAHVRRSVEYSKRVLSSCQSIIPTRAVAFM